MSIGHRDKMIKLCLISQISMTVNLLLVKMVELAQTKSMDLNANAIRDGLASSA